MVLMFISILTTDSLVGVLCWPQDCPAIMLCMIRQSIRTSPTGETCTFVRPHLDKSVQCSQWPVGTALLSFSSSDTFRLVFSPLGHSHRAGPRATHRLPIRSPSFGWMRDHHGLLGSSCWLSTHGPLEAWSLILLQVRITFQRGWLSDKAPT